MTTWIWMGFACLAGFVVGWITGGIYMASVIVKGGPKMIVEAFDRVEAKEKNER